MKENRPTDAMTLKEPRGIHRGSGLHWVGNGFPVQSLFDYNGLGRDLSPFLLLDYAAPHTFEPGGESRGVGAHPHRGFETVTLAYQGELEHRDSSGGGGRIGPGDVQWMTAGKGIVHEEFHSARFVREGGPLEMVQLWVNLPARFKDAPPGYQTLPAASIPAAPLPDGGGHLRVVAGEFAGQKGPARTFTRVAVWDVTLDSGRECRLPVPDGDNVAVLVRRGGLRVGEGRQAGPGDLVVFGREGTGIVLVAGEAAGVLVLSGEPLGEPVVGQGPFVMNTREEIQRAFEDYRQGRMGHLD